MGGQSYSFEYLTPSVGINYYRIRQVDLDGRDAYSKIISVNRRTGDKIKIYPTIVTDRLNVNSESNDTEIYHIFNALGETVQVGQIISQKELITSDLASGTYVLKIGNDVVKFVKK